ncbi:MAG TPA: tetratricopeptide repeat protein, partial [Paracoccaceae bacterium]|nr:tetratricopeptide repeat protein [Paracoccaceae bacterium]
MAGLSRTISRAMIPAVVAAMVAGAATAQEARLGIAGPYLAAAHAHAIGDVGAAARLFGEALAHDPGNLDLLESAMTHQIAAGNVPQGIELAARLEKDEPGHHLGVLALAAGELKAGDPAAAAALLPEDAPFVGRVMAAWAAYDQGEPDRAIRMLTELEAADDNGLPGQIVAAYHLGMMQAATGDDEAAAESFARATEKAEGGTLRLARLHAGALARLGRTDEAMAVIQDRLAGTYGSRTLSQLSERISDGVAPDPLVTTGEQGAAEVLYGVSGLLARGQNRIIALAYSRLATWLAPELTEAQLLVAQILDSNQQFEQAIAAYDAIPDDAPEALSARMGMAQALQAAGRTEEGLAAMRAAVEAFPDALEAHV